MKVNIEKLERKLYRLVGNAIQTYNMIEEGDRVMVAVSGGKDSWCLLHILSVLQKKAPISFELIAIHLDQGEPYAMSEKIGEALSRQSVPYRVERRQLYEIVEAKLQPGQVRCSLCSRLRRGALYTIATELKCTKIALGHHRDDLIETLLLNQFYTGRLSSMPPWLKSNDEKHIVIRPLCQVAESDLQAFSDAQQFEIFPCQSCDLQESKRGMVKSLLSQLEQDIPGVKQSLLRSLGNIRPSQLMDKELWGFGQKNPSPPSS